MRRLTLRCLIFSVGLFGSCDPPIPAPSGTWDKLLPFPGVPRVNAVSFVINNIAYVGTGFNYKQNSRLKDFWRYDPSNELWLRVSDFPGQGRSRAVAFALNGKGYVGTGTSDGVTYLQDFYEFDPAPGQSGRWEKITDFVTARAGAIAFTVNGRSFVGSGNTQSGANASDLWEFDAVANTWIQRTGGLKHQHGFVMVIDDIAYIGGGTNNDIPLTEFYKFDATQIDINKNPWSQLNSLTGKDIKRNSVAQPSPRELAATFSINDKGYLVGGSIGSNLFSDTWQYDPVEDSWLQCFSFANNQPSNGAARHGAVGFSLLTPSGRSGYMVAGGSVSTGYDEVWKFIPNGIEPDGQ